MIGWIAFGFGTIIVGYIMWEGLRPLPFIWLFRKD